MKISKENTRKIIDIIIEDRLDYIEKLLNEKELNPGDDFILTEIFDNKQWSGLYHYPGNWEVGSAFAVAIKNSNLPISRHPEGKKRKQNIIYIVE